MAIRLVWLPPDPAIEAMRSMVFMNACGMSTPCSCIVGMIESVVY